MEHEIKTQNNNIPEAVPIVRKPYVKPSFTMFMCESRNGVGAEVGIEDQITLITKDLL